MGAFTVAFMGSSARRGQSRFRTQRTGIVPARRYETAVTLDWWLALCAWLPLPVLAWLARRVQGQWLAPGALIALAWTIAAGVPLFLAPDLPVFPGAYGFVLLVSAVCVL